MESPATYETIKGFSVYDREATRCELDDRLGPRVRTVNGRIQLTRRALMLLEDVAGVWPLRQEGVLLAYHEELHQIAIAPAPSSCPPEKRQELFLRDGTEPLARRPVARGDWPAVVFAEPFLKLHGLDLSDPGGRPAQLRDGMLVVSAAAVSVGASAELR